MHVLETLDLEYLRFEQLLFKVIPGAIIKANIITIKASQTRCIIIRDFYIFRILHWSHFETFEHIRWRVTTTIKKNCCTDYQNIWWEMMIYFDYKYVFFLCNSNYNYLHLNGYVPHYQPSYPAQHTKNKASVFLSHQASSSRHVSQ